MSHWKWERTYALDIAEIDNQHKQLIDYINELTMGFTYKKSYMIEDVLNKLINYTKSHFSFEERLMEEANYPGLDSHKEIHQSFIKRIETYKERFEKGENIAKQLKGDLQIWLIHHIQETDAEYKDDIQKLLLKKESTSKTQQSNWVNNVMDKFFKK